MLGDVIAEERGQVTGYRVLPADASGVKLEVSFQAGGKTLGAEHTDMGTYVGVMRPGGTIYGEGHGIVMTRDGDSASWSGNGVGKPTGHGMGASWRGAIYYQGATGKLARLNGMAVIFEYSVDENGKTSAKTWEWK